MPRHNGSSGKRTGKRRRPQAQRGASTAPNTHWSAPLSNGLPQKRKALLPMVPTVGHCPLGKMRYGTSADAEEALRRALINREILQSPVVEERWYPQPGDAPCICQGYHLTSKPRRVQ